MIKVSVTYPGGENVRFDHDYYANSHVPLCVDAFAPTRVELERGINGPAVAAVAFYFDSMDHYTRAMSSPKMGEILGDLPNYTDAVPTMQVSEVIG